MNQTHAQKQGTQSLCLLFLHWFFLQQPQRIILNYLYYANAWEQVLSILYLLKTLFSPWKSIRSKQSVQGLNIQALLIKLLDNTVSRCVGMVVRLCTICFSFLVQLLLLVWFFAYFVAWILFPVILPLGILYILLSVLQYV